MTMFARRIALSLALLLALGGSALAQKATAARIRSDKVAVKRNRAKRGMTRRIKTRTIRRSRSGKSDQVLSQVVGRYKVEAYNVNRETNVARRTRTGLLNQHQAASRANVRARRERAPKKGTFAGIDAEGLTRRGNYKFRSRTDRNEHFFVNPASGRTVRRDK